MRKVLRGPQDLTLGDTAIHGAQAMWEKLGGHVLPLQSLGWTRILRPAGYVLDRLGGRLAGLSRLIDPLGERIWRVAARGNTPPPLDGPDEEDGVTVIDADLDRVAEVIAAIEAPIALRPDWSGAGLRWILDQAGARKGEGPLIARALLGPNGMPLGAYLYHGEAGRTANVLQVTVSPKGTQPTLMSLFRHAKRGGMVAVKGGANAPLMTELFRHQCFFRYRGATVYHSRDPAILEAIRRDDAVIGGLAGERWTRLDADPFS
jgi:hypothetical protein